MSFLNGLSGLGAGLNVFAGNAAKDAMDAMDQPARTPLLSSAPPAPAPETPAPASDAPAPDASTAGPRMPPGTNPYTGPHAAALWQAENAIKGPESGGKADAQNPVTSAGGLFQIVNGTWDASMQKMGLPVASSDVERDVQKFQPGLNTAVMRHINTEAAAHLDAAGLPVTIETLQAAHRLGPGGAVAAIKAAQADPDAPLVGSGLPSSAVRGNGDIAGMTVGQFLANPFPRSAH